MGKMMTAISRNANSRPDRSSLDGVVLEGAAELSRRNPLAVLWRQRWIIVACLAISLAGAVVYLVAAVPLYQGTAQVYVEQNTPRILANDPAGVVISGNQNYLWTQCSLIQSRAILEPVANDPTIASLDCFEGRVALAELRAMVSATVGRRDDLITIAVRSPNPSNAAQIANAIVVAFTRYHDLARRTTTEQILDILTTQKKQTDEQLQKKAQEILDFKTHNAGFTFGGERVNPALDRMARLSSSLTEVQLNTLSAQAAYETAKAMVGDAAKAQELLQSRQFKSDTAQLRLELREMQQRLAGLSKSYLPGFPELSAIQTSIKQLREEMADEDQKIIQAYAAELEAQLQADKRYEAQITALLNEQRAEVLRFNTAAAQYAKLDAEQARLADESGKIYDRIKELSIGKEAPAFNVTAVESAAIDSMPVYPNKPATLAQALVLGAAVGLGLGLLRDWIDQRLQSVEEIKQALGLPVLGVVPHMAGSRSPLQRARHLQLDSMSDVAEAYRGVRTAIYFGSATDQARTLLITSPAPGEGKTTLASNLAVAMAQAGSRVLLIDADFRRPTQHKIFELNRRDGLSSVLGGKVPLNDAIVSTSVKGLDVLPCGPVPANPSEILNSQTFADVLEELVGRYDQILLDSPPVGPVTDARILAASCDATILALRAERSTRKGALYTRDVLRSVGSRLLGVVVNDVPRRRGIYGYYYGDVERYRYATQTCGQEAGGANGA